MYLFVLLIIDRMSRAKLLLLLRVAIPLPLLPLPLLEKNKEQFNLFSTGVRVKTEV
jgi:hypothetical protein